MRYFIMRDGRQIPVDVEPKEGGYAVSLDGKPYDIGCARILDGLYSFLIEGASYEVTVHSPQPGRWDVHMYDGMRQVELLSPLEAVLRSQGERKAGRTAGVRAPMPGKVVKVLVEAGQAVEKGQGVAVVEAMKMQNELQATCDGTVARVHVKEGDSVESGAELVSFAEDKPSE